jgi:hypothetical protein
MGSGSVEGVDIGIEHPVELLLLQDEQMIEAFTPHASQKALADGIGSRGVIRYIEHLDATRQRNPREVHSKRAIVITDEVFGSLSTCRDFPKLLSSPRVGGTARDADMDHSARVSFDDEEGEKRAEEEIRDGETRRRPRSAQHACARRCSTSVLVAWPYAPVSCTSGSCVCRREGPA